MVMYNVGRVLSSSSVYTVPVRRLSMFCSAAMLTGCHFLFQLTEVEPPDDAAVQLDAEDDEPIFDAFVGPDASTLGWPTDGGVSARSCTGLLGDEDADGKADGCDNCPLDFNSDQADDDKDGVGNVCDLHPAFAVERLAYASGFNRTLAEEGAQVGTPGSYVVENGVLRQSSSTTLGRTLFVIAGGPWRRPVVELKIANMTLNGSGPNYYAGAYILQDDSPAGPEPRPDALSCSIRIGDTSRYRIVRTRDNVEGDKTAASYTVGQSATLVCMAERVGERPGVAAVGNNVAPGALTNWLTIAPETSDVEASRIGVWTYYGRAEFSGIAIYETAYP